MLGSISDDVKKLEAAHKVQFAYLSLANNLYINLYNKYFPEWKKNKNYKDTREYKIVLKLGLTVYTKAKNWFETQLYLEDKANIPKVNVKLGDFLNAKKRIDVLKQAKAWLKDSNTVNGIGIIPLIIWGVVAIVAAVSAAYITKRLTVTTEDRKELMEATAQTCKDLNISPEESGKLLLGTQQEATKNSEGFKGMTDIFKYGALAGIILLFISKSKKTQTA
jgi:hypothetical protein